MQRASLIFLMGLGLASVTTQAGAQTWPAKPVRAIVPFGAGSATDVVARVDEADKSIVFRIEFGTYPNWNGDVQKRVFTLSGDELSYVNPASTMGATKVLVVWKRAR